MQDQVARRKSQQKNLLYYRLKRPKHQRFKAKGEQGRAKGEPLTSDL
jgi:hypothetical protein